MIDGDVWLSYCHLLQALRWIAAAAVCELLQSEVRNLVWAMVRSKSITAPATSRRDVHIHSL